MSIEHRSPRSRSAVAGRVCAPGPTALAAAIAGTLVALSAGRAEAEPLSGRVVDAGSGEPIEAAQIRVSGPGGESIAEVEADGDGEFSLEGLGDDDEVRVVADAPGYGPSATEAAPGDDVELRLTADAAGEIIDIVAEAPRRREAPVEIELDREELETMPGARGDALGALDSLPGVSPPSSSLGGGQPVIRGAAEDDSMILVDGVPVPLAYHFFGLQSIIPTAMLDGIDYIPGGFGVSEGRATGGVVRLRSRDSGDIDALEGFAEMSFLDAGGYVGGPLLEDQDLSFAAAFRRSLIDTLAPLAVQDDSLTSFTTAPQYYDAQLRVDWRPNPEHRLSFFSLGSLDRISLLSDADNLQNPGVTGQFRNANDFSRAVASWRFRRGDVDSTTAAWAGHTNIDFDIGDDYFFSIGGWASGVRHDTTWQLEPWLSLDLGGDFVRDRQSVDLTFPSTQRAGGIDVIDADDFEGSFGITKPMASAYAAAEISPTVDLSVTPGLRLDYFGYLGTAILQPRLQSSLRLGSRWTVRGAAGEYSRDLRRDDSLADYLSPERARQFVLGGDYELSDTFTVSGSGYYTALRDLAVQDPDLAVQDPEGSWDSRGRGRTYGFETLVSAQTADFYGWLSYTYARSYRRDGPGEDERRFDFDRPHNLIAVGSYQRGPWRFGGQFRLASGQLSTPVVGSVYVADRHAYQPIFGEDNSERFRLAHQVDLRVDRIWTLGNFEVSAFLDITNVYARPQVMGYSYSYDYTEREAITDLPILPAIGVRGSY